MAKEPALRGQARKDFRAAQKSAAEAGQPAPTQTQFRPQAAPLRGEFRKDYRKAVQEAQASGQAVPGQEDFRARQVAAQAMQAQQRQQVQGLGSRSEGMPFTTYPANISSDQVGQALSGIMAGGQNGNLFVGPEQGSQGAGQQFIDQQLNQQMPPDKMFRFPQPVGQPQIPQPSANNGGQYRLSPGVYGSKEQAMQQYNQQMQQNGFQNVGQFVPQVRRG
jgi:hypothetical protein